MDAWNDLSDLNNLTNSAIDQLTPCGLGEIRIDSGTAIEVLMIYNNFF